MSDDEIPQVIQLVNANDTTGVRNLLLTAEAKVDELDKNGMSPLQHAAYKGQSNMVKLLLDHGADVNINMHDHGYSPLHFAALSGNIETTRLLLSAGARTYHTNSLGRVATQMAAFVGNHNVVALINNYIPFEDVEYYTKPQGLEIIPKLPKEFAKPLYDLIMEVNLHPVKIAMKLQKNNLLMKNTTAAWKVLELMVEKESKRPENVNEVLCIKLHYLSSIIKYLEKEIKKNELEKDEDKKELSKIFESLIKKLLRARQVDGFEEYLEYFIRDSLKSFPCVEMPLFMQIVRNFSGTTLGDTFALTVLSGAINGPRAFQDDVACSTCGQENKSAKKCSKCKMVQYCDQDCQKLHWTNHKKFCSMLAVEYEKKEKLNEVQSNEKIENEKNKKNVEDLNSKTEGLIVTQ